MAAAARLVAFTAALQLTPLTDALAPATLHYRRHLHHHHHHPLLGLQSRRRESFPHPHNHLSSRSWNAESEPEPEPEPELEPDYLVTDSEGLTGRPSLWSAVANPRDGLALVLCGVGLGVSYANVVGVYDDTYVRLEVISCALGALSAVAAALQLLAGYNIRAGGKRRGIADDGRVTLFGGAYSLAVSWLALRASDACPPWLWDYDQQVIRYSACGIPSHRSTLTLTLAITPTFPTVNQHAGGWARHRRVPLQRTGARCDPLWARRVVCHRGRYASRAAAFTSGRSQRGTTLGAGVERHRAAAREGSPRHRPDRRRVHS